MGKVHTSFSRVEEERINESEGLGISVVLVSEEGERERERRSKLNVADINYLNFKMHIFSA